MHAKELDQSFRTLHAEIVHEHKEQLESERIAYQRQTALRERRSTRLRAFLEQSSFDIKAFERLVKEEGAMVQDFLEQERLSLAEAPSSAAKNAKKVAHSLIFQGIPSLRVVPLYATTLLASDPSNLDGNPGEQGPLHVVPIDPYRVRMRVKWVGSGGLCAAQPSNPYSDAYSDFWFAFNPTSSGLWMLTTYVDMHGFYTMHAASDIFGCTKSIAQVFGQVWVNQYGWAKSGLQSVVDLNQHDVDVSFRRIDQLGVFQYAAYLAKGDWAWVVARISIHSEAANEGSYSEVNFADGTANYLQPINFIGTR